MSDHTTTWWAIHRPSGVPNTHEPVLVTTSRRAFRGWLDPRNVVFHVGGVAVRDFGQAQNALRWGKAGGVAGLATHGPSIRAKLEMKADITLLTDVQAIRPMTELAWDAIAPVPRD